MELCCRWACCRMLSRQQCSRFLVSKAIQASWCVSQQYAAASPSSGLKYKLRSQKFPGALSLGAKASPAKLTGGKFLCTLAWKTLQEHSEGLSSNGIDGSVLRDPSCPELQAPQLFHLLMGAMGGNQVPYAGQVPFQGVAAPPFGMFGNAAGQGVMPHLGNTSSGLAAPPLHRFSSPVRILKTLTPSD